MNIQDYINSLRVKYALKIVIAGIICVLVSNIFHLELGYFSVLFLFLIMTQAHGQVFKAGLTGLITSMICGFYSLLVTHIFFDLEILYIFLMASAIFICILTFNRLFLGSVLGGILICVVLFTSIFVSDSNISQYTGNYLKQLTLAFVVTSLIDPLVFPSNTHKTLHLTMSEVFSGLAKRFKKLAIEDGSASSHKQNSVSLSLNIFGHLLDLVTRTTQEQKNVVFPEDSFIKMVAYCKNIYRRLELLESSFLRDRPVKLDEFTYARMREVFGEISKSFQSMSISILSQSTVSNTDVDLKKTIGALEDRYISILNETSMDDEYHTEITEFGGIVTLIKSTVADLEKIKTSFNSVQNIEAYKDQTNKKLTRTKTVENKRTARRYAITTENIRQGIRTLILIFLLMIIMLILNQFFEIPADTQVAFYAVLFGIVPNLGQFKLKSKTGSFGIFFGLIYGLVGLLLVSEIQHFLFLILLFSLGYFLAAYISSGTERLAFGGLQAGLVMPYVFLISNGPIVNLDFALQRFTALVLVSLTSLVVLNLVWPINPFKQLKERLSKAIIDSGTILHQLLKLQDKEDDKIQAMVLDLASTLPTSTSLLNDAHYVIRRDDLHSEEFLEIIESLEVIYLELETLNKTIYVDIDNKAITKYLYYMSSYYLRLFRCFISVGQQLIDDISIGSPVKEIQTIIKEINDHRVKFRQSGAWKEFQREDIERIALIVSSINNTLYTLRHISLEINQIIEPKLITSPSEAI
ncbi:MAG: hypothetical protein WBD99_16575 [Thermodesulfobacteriota bacterium]